VALKEARDMEADQAQQKKVATGCKLLWLGVLGAPIAWLIQFQLRYSLVQWACLQQSALALHIVSSIFLAGTIAATAWSWRMWQRLGKTWPSDSEDTPHMRNLFLSVLAIETNVLFSLLIFAQAIAAFFVSPCSE